MVPSMWRLLGVALCSLAVLPAAEFTTYIGDVNDYHVARVAADSAGNTYLAGSRTAGSLSEAVVMKLDPTGKNVLFTDQASWSDEEIIRAYREDQQG